MFRAHDSNVDPVVPAYEMTLERTLPEDWRKAALIGRVMLPDKGPSVVSVDPDCGVIEITN